MALTPATPREKLDRIFQYVLRARRYWWLVAALMVVGGALSVGFAMTRPKVYQSGAVLYYQEQIQTSLLQNRDVSTMHRNIGERYRELLLARSSLIEIVKDPKLNPYPDVVDADGEEAAVEELRLAIDFAPRGANTFVITYKDVEPERARDVTRKLTELLQAKEGEIRLATATRTSELAEKLKAEGVADLRRYQAELNEFLAEHPEFAIDAAEGQGEGAAVRAQQEAARNRPRNPAEAALQALERQRARIKARIANPDAPPPAPEPRLPRVRTAAQVAADQKVAEAERELDAAERALTETLGKVTELHPDARRAKERVDNAKSRVAAAKAAVPPDPPDRDPVPSLPAGPVDKAQLEKALADVERLIAAERARQRDATGTTTPDAKPANWIVELEGTYQSLKLTVDQQRDRVKTLDESAFRSKLEAQQRAAESGGSLTVVDPAFKPLKPMGKGKKIVVLGGLFLFTMLGCGLALGLALIDDRVYRRHDIDMLGLAPTLAVIPRARARRVKKPAA
jgi:capsular polysaccharide biosynthesis protein